MKIYQAINNWGIGNNPEEFGFLIEHPNGDYSKKCLGNLVFYTPGYLVGDNLIIEVDNPKED